MSKKKSKTTASSASVVAASPASSNPSKEAPPTPSSEDASNEKDDDEQEEVQQGFRGQASKDMKAVTGYLGEEGIGELDQSKLNQAMASMSDLNRKQKAQKTTRDKELDKVVIAAKDVELIMSEMEVTRLVAERSLRENKGSVVETLHMSSARDRKKAYVVGVGMTKFDKPGKQNKKDYPDYGLEAATKALIDAGIRFDEVEMATVGYVFGDSCFGQRTLYQLGLTQIPIQNVNNNCSTGSTALFMARQAVAGGIVDCAMALGFEKMNTGSLGATVFPHLRRPGEVAGKLMNEIYPFDPKAPGAPQTFGKGAMEYMKEHPDSLPAHLDMIAHKNHLQSTLNPYSQFRDSYTIEQVHDARKIFGPLTLLHCSPTSDGAGCAIICSEEFVKKHGLEAQAIEIAAQVMATDSALAFGVNNHPISAQQLAGVDMTRRAANELYKIGKITAQDVDIVELHDCFSANELITYDALGICPPGKAGPWIASGAPYHPKFAPPGSNPVKRVPVNVSGGLISKGHPLGATGLAQCTEMTWQLRGWAGERQVPGVKYALQHNVGLGGAVVCTLYKKGFPDAKPSAVDGRTRLGYNPATEARPITLEQFDQAKSVAGSIGPRPEWPLKSSSESAARL
ncbi:hypothetical protein SmJEL517_g00161 [Synchytrium microbalum]|uniref:propanoyl-CoA C-acyltransferase n=1 Tax=Synchytrium microbalum TaxID=1806994 RepID=A0A507CJU2_9FUNG|nr:uncharacterized protein SmJEL517_g00161 [Synchytrium microbalum]TPX38125.1 hypothetical protein SmJEL517_g00161 [Synchytrium microbalum]